MPESDTATSASYEYKYEPNTSGCVYDSVYVAAFFMAISERYTGGRHDR